MQLTSVDKPKAGGIFGNSHFACACCSSPGITQQNSISLYGSCSLCALYGLNEEGCCHYLAETRERRTDIQIRLSDIKELMVDKYGAAHMTKVHIS